MRTRLALISLFLALTGAATPHGQRPGAGTVAIQLLAINDFHGNLEPPDGTTGRIGGVPAGGAEYLATHLKNAAAANPNSLVIGAGDIVGASPLVSALFQDEPTIESMNAMHLAVTSVGNHEFDKGSAALLRKQQLAAFRYLAANVVHAGTSPQETLFPATDVRTIGGVNVGFIGETLAGTPRIVSPTGVRGLTFLDEASAANLAAARLKAEGVNAIVLLIHQGGEQSPATDPNGCDGFHGDIIPIVEKLSAEIKVVVTGHTHQFYNCTIAGHLVTSASSFGRMVTHVNLTIDRASDSIVGATARNEIVTRDVPKDPAQTAIIAKYRERSAPIANRVVGTVTGNLTRTLNAAGESRLGDVIADAQLAATQPPDKGAALVAFMNNGGIRADIVEDHQSGGERPGEVTYSELFTVQPFSNVLTVVTMTGDAVRRLLEQQFDNPASPKVLQVSRGFTYRYKQAAPAGRHVDPASIAINGKPVAPTALVRVAANDFLITGGDGFTVFKEGRDQIGGDIDVDALVAYFGTVPGVQAGSPDRIIRED